MVVFCGSDFRPKYVCEAKLRDPGSSVLGQEVWETANFQPLRQLDTQLEKIATSEEGAVCLVCKAEDTRELFALLLWQPVTTHHHGVWTDPHGGPSRGLQTLLYSQ